MAVVQQVCQLGDVQLPMASGYNTSLLCWLQGTDSPLRAQAAKALQALKSGAEQAGLDPGALRKQVRCVQPTDFTLCAAGCQSVPVCCCR